MVSKESKKSARSEYVYIKFQIEREVILSSGDKNSKIPILNEYKKRSKVAIAPDVPPKQMAAWTQGQQQMGSDMQVSHAHNLNLPTYCNILQNKNCISYAYFPQYIFVIHNVYFYQRLFNELLAKIKYFFSNSANFQ